MRRVVQVAVLFLVIAVSMGSMVSLVGAVPRGVVHSANESGIFRVVGNSEVLVHRAGSPGYTLFIDNLLRSVRVDAASGFANVGLKINNMVRDHIILKEWGSFLYRFRDGVAVSDHVTMPGFVFRGDLVTRAWFQKEVIPLMWGVIREQAEFHVIEVYIPVLPVVRVTDALGMVDYNNLTLSFTASPFAIFDDIGLTTNSVGADFGILLDPKYVALLDAIDHENGVLKSIPSDSAIIKCVNMLATVVTPKVLNLGISGDTPLAHMATYGLYLNLLTGNLVVPATLDGFRVTNAGSFEDNKFVKEELVLARLQDAIIAIPVKYTEVVRFQGRYLKTGVTIDISGILNGADFVLLSNGKSEKVDTYVSASGIIEVVRGRNSDFLMFAAENKEPFERVVAWLASEDAKNYLSAADITSVIAAIRVVYLNNNKAAEWELLAQEFSLNRASATQIFVRVAGIGALVVVVLLGVRWGFRRVFGKKTKTKLLFKVDEEEGEMQ